MAICILNNAIAAEFKRDEHTSAHKYHVKGAFSRSAAESEIAMATPGFDGDMIRTGWSVNLVSEDDGIWEATVNYSSRPKMDIGDQTIKASTSGGSEKVMHALEHVATQPKPGKQHAGHAGAINVTDDSIEGTSIRLPAFAFTVQKAFAPGTIDDAYLQTLSDATTKVNDATWHGFARGEVLIAGIETEIGLEKETVTYSFEVFRNQTNVTVAGIEVTGTVAAPAKEGWFYLWVEYEEKDDQVNGRVVREPVAIHIERVYDYFDISLLGI